MKTYTHNLKMKGLKNASGATGKWPKNCGYQTNIYYNKRTGDIYTYTVQSNEGLVFEDPDILFIISNTYFHLSMREISDIINTVVNKGEYYYA